MNPKNFKPLNQIRLKLINNCAFLEFTTTPRGSCCIYSPPKHKEKHLRLCCSQHQATDKFRSTISLVPYIGLIFIFIFFATKVFLLVTVKTSSWSPASS